MAKPQKTASLKEAIEIHARGDEFVYNNPCSQCKKECSTPTLDIWKKRIDLFGGVEQMYTQYVCRDCRKAEKGDNPAKVKVPTSPATIIMAPPKLVNIECLPPPPSPTAHSVEMMKADLPTVIVAPLKIMPQPGEKVFAPPGKVGFSTWECESGQPRRYTGTQWHDIG